MPVSGNSKKRKQSRSEARKKRKALHKQRRIEAFKYFKERCFDCKLKSSSDNYIIFDFHHLDPSKKEISLSGSHDISNKRFWTEIKKCVMLCSNCHRMRHWSHK